MTWQTCVDEFLLENEVYEIYGLKGDLFVPEEYMIQPVASASSCWRGYWGIYTYHDDRLFLNRLEINLAENGTGNPILGLEINNVIPELQLPQYEGDIPYFNNIYEDIDLQLNFTGGIIIVKDSIEKLIDPAEYYAYIWAFKTIYELIFQDGKIIEKRDISEKMVEIRNKLVEKRLKSVMGEIDLQKLIQSSFLLNYRLLDTSDIYLSNLDY
jgi:hypothetical protein